MLKFFLRKTEIAPSYSEGWWLYEFAESFEPWTCRKYQQAAGRLEYYQNLHVPAFLDSPIDHREAEHDKNVGLHSGRVAFQQAEADLVRHLRVHLESGKLVGWGSRTHLNSKPEKISASTWHGLHYWNFFDSTVGDRHNHPSLLYRNVKIFPLLRQSNVAERIAGMPIHEAFKRFVLDDPEVRENIAKTSGFEPKYELILGTSREQEGSSLWPTNAEARSHGLPLPHDAAVILAGLELLNEAKAAISALDDRQSIFFDLLSSGRVVGNGTPQRGQASQVPASFWLDGKARLDLATGSIGFVNPSGTMQPSWTNLELALPTRRLPELGKRILQLASEVWRGLGALLMDAEWRVPKRGASESIGKFENGRSTELDPNNGREPPRAQLAKQPTDYYKPFGKGWNAIVDAIFELSWESGVPRKMARQTVTDRIAAKVKLDHELVIGDRTIKDVLKAMGI